MDMRSHEMIERRRDDNGNNNGGVISNIISTNDDNCNGNNNNNNTRVSCNSQTLDHHQSKSPSSFSISAAVKSSTVRYRECLKNHAANVGGSVHDGCGEFMPSGEEGTIEALRCAACDCHRNFHRKEIDGVGSSDLVSHHRHHHHHHNQYGGGGGGRRPPPQNMMLNPLMLPPPPNYQPIHHHKYGMSPPGGGGMVTPMSVAYGGGGGAESSSEDLNLYGQSSGEGAGAAAGGQMAYSMSSSKKRFRTKFTTEQKERMMEFAEKLGWRMNKQDEEELKRFCGEIGVKRQVFKVWMHNNKNNAKKPPTPTTL
ncbi:PREDICTED: zinc-finger homeodomain protein 5 [Camelina sativa]|uniref:Zinc-finger homeodomain protein 5 n=1 Tax=Camelina sativa TaxID=90675 RepID=A0ABM0TMH2_CAMSA|nr:PREDICTED: zinc-finger homeodomain protein 5 [Camelina sativa]XP_010428535.1 PREDICTED: zinc-finger homeodomain protein 5 [Camelina sativa]